MALHTVAEHVLAPARFAATGHIGLRPAPGGIGTGELGEAQLRLDGVDLVVERGAAASRHPLTTLGAAAAAAEVDLDGWHGLYPAATPADPTTALVADPTAAATLAAWFALADDGLGAITTEPATLWPEHFDLAVVVAECNLGASPGDVAHPEPYLYVGPFAPGPYVAENEFWNEPFGASRPWRLDLDLDEAVAFWREGLARLQRPPA